MKIYTQNYNLNERTDKQFYCPPNSNFKIGIKATENGQEVALSDINLYDGTSDGYMNQTYTIKAIPEGASPVCNNIWIKNCTGRDIKGLEYVEILDLLTYSVPGKKGAKIMTIGLDARIAKTCVYSSTTAKGDGWYYGTKKIDIDAPNDTFLSANGNYIQVFTCNVPVLSAQQWWKGRLSNDNELTFKKYGYKTSDTYKDYKTFDISSDYDSKTYDVQIKGYEMTLLSSVLSSLTYQGVTMDYNVYIYGMTEPSHLKLTQNVTDSTVYDIAEGGGSEYVLPVASSSTLGGVKVNGNNLTIAADGTLSAAAGSPYVLPVASSNTLGGVKVNGNGMAIAADGTLSCTVQGGGSTVQDTEFISYNLAEHQPSTPSWMHMFDLYEIPITLDGGTKFIDLYTTGTAPSSGVDISFKVTRPQGSPNPNGYMYKSTTIYLKRDTLADPMVCMYIDDTSLSLTVSEVYQCDNTYKGPTFTANGNFLDDVHYPVVDASNASVPSKITLTPYMLGDGTIGYIMKCEYFNEQS